eukprot:gene1686-3259_t
MTWKQSNILVSSYNVCFGKKNASSTDRAEKKRILMIYLFITYFFLLSLNSTIVPIKDSLTLAWGKSVKSTIMLTTPISSMLGQILLASGTAKFGPVKTLAYMMYLSAFLFICTAGSVYLSKEVEMFFTIAMTVFLSVSTIGTISLFWSVVSDVLPNESFGIVSSGGTLGQFFGSAALSYFVTTLGCKTLLGLIAVPCLFCATALHSSNELLSSPISHKSIIESNAKDKESSNVVSIEKESTSCSRTTLQSIVEECETTVKTLVKIFKRPLLRNAMIFSVMWSATMGLVSYEKSTTANSSGINRERYASLIGYSQLLQAVIQFSVQMFGTRPILKYLGPTSPLCGIALLRLSTFAILIYASICAAMTATPPDVNIIDSSDPNMASIFDPRVLPFVLVVLMDISARFLYQTLSRPVREGIWELVPMKSKHRSKVMVDVFGHRLGTSLAAALAHIPVSTLLGMLPSQLQLLPWAQIQDHNIWGTALSIGWFMSCFTLGSCIVTSTVLRKEKEKNL